MKYIKEYNEHNPITIEDIKECFIDLIDMDINLKVLEKVSFMVKPGKSKIFEVSIILEDRLLTGMSKSKWGKYYRAVRDGDEIVDLFINGIEKCEGYLDMDIFKGQVNWVSAGEWAYNGKKEIENRRDNLLNRSKEEDKLAIKKHFSSLIAKFNLRREPVILECNYNKLSRNRLSDLIIDKGKIYHSILNIEDMKEDVLLKGDRCRYISVSFVI